MAVTDPLLSKNEYSAWNDQHTKSCESDKTSFTLDRDAFSCMISTEGRFVDYQMDRYIAL
jgi:hypothetical protein